MGNAMGGVKNQSNAPRLLNGAIDDIIIEKKPRDNEAQVKTDNSLETCPFDPRFPHTNQTKRCFINFVDYHRCERALGSYERCQPFYKCYMSMCPTAWIEKWEEQMEEGTFPVKLPAKNTKGNDQPHENLENGA